MLTSLEIRRQFLDYFVRRHGHTIVPSSPVVAHKDPTLLFTNAGMNQFKEIFLGTGRPESLRVVNTQKCIRAGGKHNDLEDVGKDTYHHTFFEMLGNWSFGDYFKKEAIEWAWDLLTGVWGLEKDRLHATVFGGNPVAGLDRDDEAADLWRTATDIEPSHIHDGGMKDNFWEMGETGPCGPCSEIHIDLTPDKSGIGLVNADDARVIEIWNLVFIQFNRDIGGELAPLPAQHVDTGLGFERLCAILQHKDSNYDTDVFTPLFDAVHKVTGARPYGARLGDPIDTAYRVIADHVRCLTFALTDGAVPGNEGRGYVLRRILRRAVRHGWQTLGTKEPFLCNLVPAVVDTMGDVFPELRRDPQKVGDLIREEEESFDHTLDRGIALFEQAAARGSERVTAEDAFKLHDTYGFPLDLTQVMAEERGMSVDVTGFDGLMEEARRLARGSGGGIDREAVLLDLVQKESLGATEFEGYTRIERTVATFCQLYQIADGGPQRLEEAESGREVAVVVGTTPFYGESGGQVGDAGMIESASGARLAVRDTAKVGDIHVHLAVVESGTFRSVPPEEKNPSPLTLRVDARRRAEIMANHTSTHLLNRALRLHVNHQADQKGSLVDEHRLRFDFSNRAAVTDEQIDQVERTVNEMIAADLPVYHEYAPQQEARRINGLRAVFGEKYPTRVRVVSIGVPVADLLADPEQSEWSDYSIEFCGGTHLARTGDAEGFVVITEEAVAKGVRRITALTGKVAHQCSARGDLLLRRAKALTGVPGDELPSRISGVMADVNEGPLPVLARTKIQTTIGELQKLVKDREKKRSREAAGDVVDKARRLADGSSGDLIVGTIEGADAASLRTAMDVIRKKRPDAALLLASLNGDKVGFLAAVPKEKISRGLKAGDWVREVAKVAGGGGGGRPDMAQAGGKDPSKIDEALKVGREFAKAKVS